MRTTQGKGVTMALGFVLVAAGTAAGWWWGHRTAVSQSDAASENASDERAILYWYDPMSPQHHFDRPGKSPFMDMDLVPKYASDTVAGDASDGGVRIDARITQNVGVRAARVERIVLASVIEATGLIAFNERDVAIEQARSAGLVERVWPLAPGDVIAAGQPLVELLVPQWTAAQAEYLALRAGADRALVDAARERLRMLGLSAAMIDELEQSGRARQRFILYSSRGGVLESLDVRSGMAVAAGQTLARVQGIDSMWLEVAVPESRATSVQMGGDAEVQFVAYPGRSLTGRIIAVLPDLAAGSRTLRVRIELPNPDGQLRAGMSAQVRLAANTGGYALAVPTEAIIRTGKRALVIAVREDGAFSGVEVELGPEIDNRTVIVAGLAEGQSIVSSAQFLLDSEASLSGLFAPAAPATTLPESLPDEAANAMGEER
jgi:Cu(I)/Ag(I) efflux system membrane fusion protein